MQTRCPRPAPPRGGHCTNKHPAAALYWHASCRLLLSWYCPHTSGIVLYSPLGPPLLHNTALLSPSIDAPCGNVSHSKQPELVRSREGAARAGQSKLGKGREEGLRLGAWPAAGPGGRSAGASHLLQECVDGVCRAGTAGAHHLPPDGARPAAVPAPPRHWHCGARNHEGRNPCRLQPPQQRQLRTSILHFALCRRGVALQPLAVKHKPHCGRARSHEEAAVSKQRQPRRGLRPVR